MIYRRKAYDVPPVSPQKDNTLKSKSSVFKGFLMAILSGACYSVTAVIVKKLKNLHPGQLSVYRFIGMLVVTMPETVKSGENPFGPQDLRLLLVIQAILGVTASYLGFVAFRYLPLGEAAVIIFSLPVFVTVIARIFLKEPCGIFQSVTVLLTVIGIIFTAKIPSRLMGKSFVYTSENIFGFVAAFGAMLFNASRYVVVRKLKKVHHSVIMFIFCWVAMVENVSLTFIIGDFQWHKCGMQGIYILLLGLMGYAGQVLLTMALQCELAGPVSTMRAASDIVLAFVWQTLLFHDIPDYLSVTGAVLVGFSVVAVGLMKWVSTLEEDSTKYKRLRWIVA